MKITGLTSGMFSHGALHGVGAVLTRYILVPTILVAALMALWWWLGPEKPTCDADRKEVANAAVEQAVVQVRAAQGGVRRAALLHLVNDPTDYMTLALRKRLMEGGWLDLDGTPPSEKIRNLFNFRNKGEFDYEKALEYGKDNELDAVIIGNLDRFETTKDGAVLVGKLKFIRVAKGEVVEIPLAAGDPSVVGEKANALAEKAPPAAPADGGLSLTTRICLLVVCVIALPLATFPFLKMAMRKDSNVAAATALISLVAIDGVLIRAFLGGSDNFFGLAIFLVALAASFGYDMFMLSYAQLCRPPSPGE